jgi:hypothetical protein
MASSTACAPTDRIMQTLRVGAPGATDAVIELTLFNVIDEFLRRTSAWRYPVDIQLDGDTLNYPLALPPDSVVVRALSVFHNGIPVPESPSAAAGDSATIVSVGRLLPEQTFADGDASFAPAVSDLAGGVFTYAIYRPDYITISSAPDAEAVQYPLNAIMALSIAPSCVKCACGDWQLEEWMYEMFFQDWVDGTLGRLFGMPAKPWSNKELMVYHGKRFRVAMGSRKQEAVRGFIWDKPAWSFPGGWGRR